VDSDIWAFAGLTADFNPLHCDDIFAAEHHFGDRVTHGPMLIGMAFGLGARAGMRVRILPVLGPLPAIFGQALAAFVLCALAGAQLHLRGKAP
jgi:acyl dehydratase